MIKTNEIAKVMNEASPWVKGEHLDALIKSVKDAGADCGVYWGPDGCPVANAFADVKNTVAAQNAVFSANFFSKFGPSFFENSWSNLRRVNEQNGIDILADGRFKGQPAILACGAETIYANLDGIAELADFAFVWAVDSVWRIIPRVDFVVNLDVQPKILEHYRSAWNRADGRTLIMPISGEPIAARNWAGAGGQVLWFRVDNGETTPAQYMAEEKALTEAFGPGREITAGLNSTICALKIMAAAGFDPILVVGCDYAWRARADWAKLPTWETLKADRLLAVQPDACPCHPDGAAWTTDRLYNLAQFQARTFNNTITAEVIARDAAGNCRFNFTPHNAAPIHYAGFPEDASLWLKRRPLMDLANELIKGDKLDRSKFSKAD